MWCDRRSRAAREKRVRWRAPARGSKHTSAHDKGGVWEDSEGVQIVC